jgi:hypothetical protein
MVAKDLELTMMAKGKMETHKANVTLCMWPNECPSVTANSTVTAWIWFRM